MKVSRYNLTHTGNRYVYIFPRDKSEKQRRISAPTIEETIHEIELEIERRAGEKIKPPKSDKLSDILDFRFKFTVDNRDSVNYRNKLAIYENFIKGSPIDKSVGSITVDDVQQLFAILKKSARLRTIEFCRDLLVEASEIAAEYGYSTIDFSEIQVRDTRSRVLRNCLLTPEQYDSVLQCALAFFVSRNRDKYEPLVFCLYNGMFFAEVIALKCKGIDLENGTITVFSNRGANPKQRVITMSDEFKAWVDKQDTIGNFIVHEKMPEDQLEKYVFTRITDESDSEPLSRCTLPDSLSTVMYRCEMPWTIAAEQIPKSFVLRLIKKYHKSSAEVADLLDLSLYTIMDYIQDFKYANLM